MVSDIIDGISNALYANFEGITVYSESVEQGLIEPCFFVMPLNPSETSLIGDRAIRNVPMDIHYFPFSKSEPRAEMELTASKLYGVLRRIALLDGNKLNGMNLHHEIENGVLHFFVEYKPIIRYPKTPDTAMETFTHNTEVL